MSANYSFYHKNNYPETIPLQIIYLKKKYLALNNPQVDMPLTE